MPIYEYECRKCGHTQEIHQKKSIRLAIWCPQCASGCDRKFPLVGGFRFKGPGFYATDYKDK